MICNRSVILRGKHPYPDTTTERFICAGDINLSGSHIDGCLELQNAILGDTNKPSKDTVLNVSGAKIQGHAILLGNTEIYGTVDLRRISVDGWIDCAGASIIIGESGQKALNLQSAIIRSSLFLSRGFRTTGFVDLMDVQIEENLEC